MRRGAVLEQEDALQVPSCSRPSVRGMLSWVWVSALLMWAGMSSGPSSLPGYNARQPEHAAEQDEFMRVRNRGVAEGDELSAGHA